MRYNVKSKNICIVLNFRKQNKTKKDKKMKNVKVYTDGINKVAGFTKGTLSKKDFYIRNKFEPTKEEIKLIEQYGNCILKNGDEYVFFAKEPHSGCLYVEADKKRYDYQFSND